MASNADQTGIGFWMPSAAKRISVSPTAKNLRWAGSNLADWFGKRTLRASGWPVYKLEPLKQRSLVARRAP
jgi:hypothetical protein